MCLFISLRMLIWQCVSVFLCMCVFPKCKAYFDTYLTKKIGQSIGKMKKNILNI